MKNSALIFIIAALTMGNCMPDAERDNPFDPKSDGYQDEGMLTGSVSKTAQPAEGIEGVTVSLNPPRGSATTNMDGTYSITNIPSGSYVALAFKTGFS